MLLRQKRIKNYRPLLALAGVVVVLLGTGWFARGAIRDVWYNVTRPSVPEAVAYSPVATSPSEQKPSAPAPVKPTSTKPAPAPVPVAKISVNLAVPFLLQAPNQNWVQPYEDACEEASLVMVDAYYDGRTKTFGADEALKALDALFVFEDETYGYNKDTTSADVANTAKVYFHRQSSIVEATEANIKKALNEGHPVIAPAHGKELGNPNFRNGGPEYHMLVIKGYTKDGSWITNDPGTRNGPDYVYGKQVLLNAIHDFDPRDMRTGRKVVIIVTP